MSVKITVNEMALYVRRQLTQNPKINTAGQGGRIAPFIDAVMYPGNCHASIYM